MHGGIGMTAEYPVGHYVSRLVGIEHTLGASDDHLRVLAAAWTDAGGTVLGAAPSAVAAHELRKATGHPAVTLAAALRSITASQRQPGPERGKVELRIGQAAHPAAHRLAIDAGRDMDRGDVGHAMTVVAEHL